MSAQLSNKGSEWTLRIPLTCDTAPLDGIPGLRVREQTAVGLVDAIAAACAVLKLAAPHRNPVEPREDAFLFPFQSAGVARLLEITQRCGGALLADDVGLGKTRQALTYTKIRGGRTLIVCPAYVRRSWESEILKLQPNANVITRDTLPTKARRQHYETNSLGATYVITSYELAQHAIRECFSHSFPTTLVMDEAHYLCGRNSKRSRALAEIAALVPYKLALTATPAWNRPRDFYSLLRVLFGSRFGSPSAFDFRYCAGAINEYGG